MSFAAAVGVIAHACLWIQTPDLDGLQPDDEAVSDADREQEFLKRAKVEVEVMAFNCLMMCGRLLYAMLPFQMAGQMFITVRVHLMCLLPS